MGPHSDLIAPLRQEANLEMNIFEMLQGLASGDFSFQVRVIDAAGNKGNATENYLFSVDSSLKDTADKGSSHWGLGWKFWLIIGGGSVLVVVVVIALAAFTALKLKKGPRRNYARQENLVVSCWHVKTWSWYNLISMLNACTSFEHDTTCMYKTEHE